MCLKYCSKTKASWEETMFQIHPRTVLDLRIVSWNYPAQDTKSTKAFHGAFAFKAGTQVVRTQVFSEEAESKGRYSHLKVMGGCKEHFLWEWGGVGSWNLQLRYFRGLKFSATCFEVTDPKEQCAVQISAATSGKRCHVTTAWQPNNGCLGD